MLFIIFLWVIKSHGGQRGPEESVLEAPENKKKVRSYQSHFGCGAHVILANGVVSQTGRAAAQPPHFKQQR